jgi:hypothetical protein
MHHQQHRPLRLASAEPATVTVATAYEGAVLITSCSHNPMTCPDRGVRFVAYNGRVTTTNDAVPAPAAKAVAR